MKLKKVFVLGLVAAGAVCRHFCVAGADLGHSDADYVQAGGYGKGAAGG